MKAIRCDNMSVPSQKGAPVSLKSSKGIVERPFQYISIERLKVLRWMIVEQDGSGTTACDVVVAGGEGSRCAGTPTATSPATVPSGSGAKRGRRGDRGGRGVRGA